MAFENDPEFLAIFKGEPHQALLLARLAELMERRIGKFVQRVLDAKDDAELKMTDAQNDKDVAQRTLKQREEHITELQARLDREFALSERLKAQVAGLKGEVASLDASNKAIAPFVLCVCSKLPKPPEEVERAKSYLRTAFS
jgi:galactokinase/mevalonate kinase-like predicted kinase